MARVRANFFEGTLSSQLLVGATTLMSSALATFPEVTAPDVAYLVIGNTADTKEIVKVTAHSVAATTATIVRAQDSTTDRTWSSGVALKQTTIASDVDAAELAADSEFADTYVSIEPLAEVVYDPGSTTTLSTTSSTFADIDATNLVVTFDAPASGEVIVEQEAMANSSGAVLYIWNLRDAGGDITGTDHGVARQSDTARVTLRQKVTGLTPGDTYSWKWGHKVASAATGRIICGSPYGQARMTVVKA